MPIGGVRKTVYGEAPRLWRLLCITLGPGPSSRLGWRGGPTAVSDSFELNHAPTRIRY
jgi:hypothetical protein